MVRLDLEKIGYLYKLRNKQWKKRWFILRHGILYKYYSHKDKYPYGQYVWNSGDINVQQLDSDVPSKEAKHFCFMVTHKRSHHIFAAGSEEELQEWMTAIAGEDINLYDNVESDGGSKILGVTLSEIEHRNNEGLPIFLTCLMDYIEATAVGKEDLFTQAPDPVLITQIKEGVLDFELIKSPHAVAGLIQVFLHEMPIPVLTFELRACFLGVNDIVLETTKIQILHSLCQVLPPLHYNLLHRLCYFLKKLYTNTTNDKFLDHLVNTFSVLILRSPKNDDPLAGDLKALSRLDLTSERELMNEITRYLIKYCDQICPMYIDLQGEDYDDEEDELHHFIMENESFLSASEEISVGSSNSSVASLQSTEKSDSNTSLSNSAENNKRKRKKRKKKDGSLRDQFKKSGEFSESSSNVKRSNEIAKKKKKQRKNRSKSLKLDTLHVESDRIALDRISSSSTKDNKEKIQNSNSNDKSIQSTVVVETKTVEINQNDVTHDDLVETIVSVNKSEEKEVRRIVHPDVEVKKITKRSHDVLKEDSQDDSYSELDYLDLDTPKVDNKHVGDDSSDESVDEDYQDLFNQLLSAPPPPPSDSDTETTSELLSSKGSEITLTESDQSLTNKSMEGSSSHDISIEKQSEKEQLVPEETIPDDKEEDKDIPVEETKQIETNIVEKEPVPENKQSNDDEDKVDEKESDKEEISVPVEDKKPEIDDKEEKETLPTPIDEENTSSPLDGENIDSRDDEELKSPEKESIPEDNNESISQEKQIESVGIVDQPPTDEQQKEEEPVDKPDENVEDKAEVTDEQKEKEIELDPDTKEEEEDLAKLNFIPQSNRERLGTFSKNAGPSGRKRPTRRFKSPIIIPEFTVIPEESPAVKVAPTPRMTPEQQMILEMSRLFKRKQN